MRPHNGGAAAAVADGIGGCKLSILKLFRLHPETQDLQIKGFFKELCPDFFDISLDDHGPEFYSDNLDWEDRIFHSDRSWTSFVNKMKREKAFQQLMLYADSSELKHYDVLDSVDHLGGYKTIHFGMNSEIERQRGGEREREM
jgi:hypothetical protein